MFWVEESMKYHPSLPLAEKRHFMKCSCGQHFDMRDLNDVLDHLHEYQEKLKTVFSHSVRVGEPTAFTRGGGKMDLN